MTAAVPALVDVLRQGRRRALHLELRDTYPRTERFVAWQEGRPYDRSSVNDEWRYCLASLLAAGADIRRLRVFSEPWTDDLRYEHLVTPQMNVAAGELVRWLPRHNASDLLFPGNDFWLIDDHLLFNLFAGNGEFVEMQVSDSADVMASCVDSFDRAWERGIDHADFQPV